MSASSRPLDPLLAEVDTPPIAPALAASTVLTPPVPRRRSRAIGALPLWVVVALVLVVAIAGLLLAPSVVPWSRSPVQSPLDDPVPGFGALGTETAGSASTAGPGASGDATGSVDATGGTDPTGGPDATASASPSAAPSADVASRGVEIAFFSVTPLPLGLTGYRVIVEITNRDALPQVWHNVAVQVNGGVPLSLKLEEPAAGVRAYAGQRRACVAPTGSDSESLAAGETLRIAFQINALLSNTPGPARLNDAEGCASAES